MIHRPNPIQTGAPNGIPSGTKVITGSSRYHSREKPSFAPAYRMAAASSRNKKTAIRHTRTTFWNRRITNTAVTLTIPTTSVTIPMTYFPRRKFSISIRNNTTAKISMTPCSAPTSMPVVFSYRYTLFIVSTAPRNSLICLSAPFIRRISLS